MVNLLNLWKSFCYAGDTIIGSGSAGDSVLGELDFGMRFFLC